MKINNFIYVIFASGVSIRCDFFRILDICAAKCCAQLGAVPEASATIPPPENVCYAPKWKNMKLFAKRLLAALLVVGATKNVAAAELWCGGKVAELAFHQPGKIVLRLSSMNSVIVICSVDGDWNVPGSRGGVTTTSSCKTMYATLLAAKHANVSLGSVVFDANVLPTACTGFTPWQEVNVRFIN
jgi:hypothetical protein